MNDIHRHVTELLRKVRCNPRQRKELEEELLDHLTLLYEEYMEKGYPPDEAERRALAAFGDVGKIGWEINRVWTGGYMRMRKWWMAIWLWLGIACMWKAYDLLM